MRCWFAVAAFSRATIVAARKTLLESKFSTMPSLFLMTKIPSAVSFFRNNPHLGKCDSLVRGRFETWERVVVLKNNIVGFVRNHRFSARKRKKNPRQTEQNRFSPAKIMQSQNSLVWGPKLVIFYFGHQFHQEIVVGSLWKPLEVEPPYPFYPMSLHLFRISIPNNFPIE